MNSLLQSQFEAIENQKRAIGAQIEALSESQRVWKPRSGDWSALQIVEHLVRGDETVGSLTWSRGHLQKRAAPRVHPRRLKLILWALRHNVRLPLPSPELEPRGEVSWPELAARWDETSLAMRAHLEAPDSSSARLFFHTVAGALSTGELLELAQAHNAYHARQLSRLIGPQPPRNASK